ncbi:MAG: CARDB domain-containing protein [Myxococcaceae bacterium]
MLALIATSAMAQTYVLSTSSSTYSPLSGGTAVTWTGRVNSGYTSSNEGYMDIPLQFSFPWYGQSYNQVHVDTNGFLSFDFTTCDSTAVYPYYCEYMYASSLPSTTYGPYSMIAGWWYDFDMNAFGATAGSVTYKSSATQLEVEYLNMPDYYGEWTATMKYTIKNDGTVQVAYGSLGGFSPTYAEAYGQGYENADGSKGGRFISTCTSYCDYTEWPGNKILTLGPPAGADMLVTQVLVSNMVVLGNGNLTFNVAPTFLNFGQTAVSNVQWKAYLSYDSLLDPTDQVVYTSASNLNLGTVASGTNTASATGAAATTTAPTVNTPFYIIVQVDSSGCANGSTTGTGCGTVTEQDESNNTGITANYFIQGVDLVATSIAGPATTGPGNTVQFEAQYFNQGTQSAGTVRYQILFSVDQTPSAGDFVVSDATRTVTGGQSVDDVLSITLPDNTPGGDFYIILVLDPANAIAEADEGNNYVASFSQTAIRPAELVNTSTDFLDTVTSASTRIGYFGGNSRVVVNATNTGGADAKPYKIGVIVSTDSTPSLLQDTLVWEQAVPSLATMASQTYDFTFQMPLNDKNGNPFATGNYYVFTVLDSTSAVNEINKTNNILPISGVVQLRAPGIDLTPSSVQAPSAGGVGETVPVVRTLKNIGNLDSTAAKYRYYASANAIITPDDTPMKIVGSSGTTDFGTVTLLAGQADTQTELVQLPPTLPPGTYYIGVIIDTDATVSEWDETNNSLASTAINLAGGSLTVTTNQLPDAIQGRPYSFGLAAVGAMGTLSWNVDTTQGDLPMGLTLSTDGLLSGTPTATSVSAFTVLVSDGVHQAAGRLVVRVLPTTTEVEITTTSIPPVINSPSLMYSYQLGAAGGLRPYTWTVVSGTLPANLKLSQDGLLSGSPRAGLMEGRTSVTVQVADSLGTKATQVLSVRVLAPGSIQFSTLTLPDGLVGQDYGTDISVQNGDMSALATPVVFELGGALPDGVLFDPEGNVVLLSGRPTHAGTYPFTITVTDAKGRSDTADFLIHVYPSGLTVTGKSMPDVMHPGDSAGFSFVASTGLAAHFTIFSGAMPPGLSLNDDGTVGGKVNSSGAVGSWDFVVQATDATGATGLGAYRVDVVAVPKKASGCGCNDGSGSALWLLGMLIPLAVRSRRRSGGARAPKPSAAARKAIVLGAALAVLLPAAAFAQDYQLVGPTNISYQAIPSGTALNPGFEGVTYALPFPFSFYGTTAGSFTVSQYGYVAFSGDGYEEYNNGIPGGQFSDPLAFVAPWWDDLDYSIGTVRAQTFGTAPTRYTVIEWAGMQPSGYTGTFSFEAIFYESTNQIRFAYGSTPPSAGSATVGLQKDGSTGLAALSCTSSSSGSCGVGGFPANSAIDFFLPPDLVIQQVSGDQVGYANVAYRASAVISNIGGRGVLASPGAKVRFYLSTDATYDSGDQLMGESVPAAIDPYQQKLVQGATHMPASVTPGNYFVIGVIDPDNAVAESNENNNIGVANPVTIGPPTPDLIVTQVTAPTTSGPGQQIQINRAISNIGNAAAGSFKYTYFISNNSVVTISDVKLDPVGTVASLDPSMSDSAMELVTLPSNLPAGKYYIGACVNYDASATQPFGITEISLVNDCATGNAITLSTGQLAVVTPASLPAATKFAPYGAHLEATGGDGTYVWSLTGGTLPLGMTLSATGDLTGNPNKSGAFTFTVSVASAGTSQTSDLTLTVADGSLPLAIVDQQLPAAEFSRNYQVALVAVGGKPPYTWTLNSDSVLPAGLALSPDGLLEGRAAQAGDFPFSVTLTDADGTTAAKDLQVSVVNPANLAIALHALPTAYLKSSYLVPLAAVGGKAPYTWDLESFQQLPQNLTEGPGPVLTAFPDGFGIAIEDGGNGSQYLRGTPALAGLYTLTLKVTDATGATDFAQLLLEVSYAAGLQITTTALPDAFIGHDYKTVLSTNAESDVTGLQFDIPCVMQPGNNGQFGCITVADPHQNVPPGIVLAADGSIEGTPLADSTAKAGTATTYTFLVRVKDASGREDVRGLAVKVQPDYAKVKSGGGCSSFGLDPSMLGLLGAAALLLKRRKK